MKLSQTKKDKISEQILSLLYASFPGQPFTAEVAREVARDEEFTKRLLFDLAEKGLVIPVRNSSSGEVFIRRLKWRLSQKVYDVYRSKE
jgi:hypothetical protein